MRLLAPEPVRAREILGADPIRFPHGRLLVLAEASGDVLPAGVAAAAQRPAGSELPVEFRIVGADDDPGRRQLLRLVRAYGLDRLTVLLTLDADARVMRVEPL